MNINNYQRKKATEEIHKIAKDLRVFIIMKNGETAGRITIRYIGDRSTKSTFEMFGPGVLHQFAFATTDTRDNLGYHENVLVAFLLVDKAHYLCEYCGVNFSKLSVWVVCDEWRKAFAEAGFQVIEVL